MNAAPPWLWSGPRCPCAWSNADVAYLRVGQFSNICGRSYLYRYQAPYEVCSVLLCKRTASSSHTRLRRSPDAPLTPSWRTTLKPTPAQSSGMRPKTHEASINWLMVFVVAVVAFGLVLLVTDEFGAAAVEYQHSQGTTAIQLAGFS